jgi:hypothetical protein
MIFHGSNPFRHLPAGQRMILEHAAWLTNALRLNGRARPGFLLPDVPRIPVRKVNEGGFAAMMSTGSGRYRAERWWESTLDQMKE